METNRADRNKADIFEAATNIAETNRTEQMTEINRKETNGYNFFEILVRKLIEMEARFKKVYGWEEVLDLPEGLMAEKAGDPTSPRNGTSSKSAHHYSSNTNHKCSKKLINIPKIKYYSCKLQMLLCYLLFINTQGYTTNY